MTSYVYASAFSGADPVSATPTGTDPHSTTQDPASNQPSTQGSSQGLASFICHVAFLDDNLQRGDRSAFFAANRARLVNRKRIGNGISFIVERAELDTTEESAAAKVVVVKTAREDQHHRNQWAEVLLEIRALLHEPIRYHPNIVRLLDIRWDASIDTGSPFPAIVQEYASIGTLDKLQRRSEPLPFSIKQKLCYDVGRALSIIHACGMVHGDLKHENVLIFPNPYPDPPNQPYTAKLADFGGTVMDMSGEGTHRIPMHTFPYEAPEIAEKLTEEGAKKTDAYSYGMLVWRCMIDSQDILATLGMTTSAKNSVDSTLRDNMRMMKLSDGLLEAAIHNVAEYFFRHHIPSQSFNLVTSALMFTLRGEPKQRALDRAQVRLRGMEPVAAYHYVGIKDEANEKTLESKKHRTPGRHGMDLDSVGFALGRLGNDYDPQNNLPGFRPDLPHPTRGGFLFEPLRLRHLLDRSQQETMVREFEAFTNGPAPSETDDLRPEPWSAAFFLFQSYLCGFGASFDAEKACYWLRRAADPPEEQATTDYLALAWLNRVHAALGVPNPYDAEKQIENLFWGAVRGHRHCFEDAEVLISQGTAAQKQAWRQKMGESDLIYRALTGSTGMPFFAPRKLTRAWDLNDLSVLDSQLKQELGRDYDGCLRPPADSEDGNDPVPDGGYRFDKIYINHKGHGLLHLAALQGRLPALKHIHEKYLCDINLKNQSHGDTALICACRTNRFDVAVWLLDNAADPNGGQFCEESPLHCISSFTESEMEIIVTKLLAAGADVEKHSEASRKDVRGILADWEDTFTMTLTPLGRAVLKQSLPAVRVLLKHGASPTGQHVDRNRANLSPVELAAVLTLPDVLEELLKYVDGSTPVFDECEMLTAARSGKITPYDPLSLHSRLVRCGEKYQDNLLLTLTILHNRRKATSNKQEHILGKHLCDEILLGNTDIVSSLLSLGHSADGSPGYRPIVTAVRCNNPAIFHLLMAHGPPLAYTDDGYQTLLHFLAARLPHSPADLTLAEYLLEHGAEDSIKGDEPSPLVLAVRNGFFRLADLLLGYAAGRSLGVVHSASVFDLADSISTSTSTSKQNRYSLLGFLLQSQTSSSLQKIAYLSQIHRSTTVKIPPLVATSGMGTSRVGVSETDTFQAGTSNSEDSSHKTSGIGISAVHALSLVPPSEWNSHGQISARIIQLVLEMFPSVESLGDWAVHPTLGTPMGAAVGMGHVELVKGLWAGGYRRLWNVEVDGEWDVPGTAKQGDVKVKYGELLPLGLARIMALREYETCKRGTTEEELDGLKRRIEIVRLLEDMQPETPFTHDQTPGLADWKKVDFDTELAALQKQIKPDFAEPHIDREGDGVNLPADLSVLTDERPTGWTEGCEMTSEMSLRIFLRHFRKDNQAFGDGIVKAMSKMFNKREDDES